MNNKIKVKKLFLLILFVQFIAVTFAQMSDDQVVAIVKEAQNQGKTQQQIIMMLGQKGVTQEQLIRIKNNYTGKKYGRRTNGERNEPVEARKSSCSQYIGFFESGGI